MKTLVSADARAVAFYGPVGGALAARVFAGILAGWTRVGDVVARATVLITAGVSGTLVKYLSFDGAGRYCACEMSQTIHS